jgi:hypothetical protein
MTMHASKAMTTKEDVLLWLVEHVESRPCPVYATDGPYPTCDPYEAEAFSTEEQARAWMTRPGVIPFFFFPWKPVLHGFVGLGHVDD